MNKKCTQCKINERVVSKVGNKTYLCKECSHKKSVEYYTKNKTRMLKISSTWLKNNRDRAYALNKKSREKRRLMALQAYSSKIPTCSCCGEKQIEFLTIDHINGGGRKHRKVLGDGGQTLYGFLKQNGYPKGFRVLCYNCNSCLGHYNYCPHNK
jgi:hypothetical protein